MFIFFLLFIAVFAQTTPSGFYCKLPEVEPAQFRYLSLSDIEKENGSDSDSSSGNDDDEKDVSKMKCVTADSTGVYKFGSNQLSVGSEVKIYGQQGHKIVVDLSADKQTALTIEAEEGALGSLTLNVPASGNVKSVTFGSNVNAATVEFKLVETGKTVGSPIQLNGNVQFTFKYVVATGSTINYSNYRTVEMPASTNYVIVFDGIMNVATTTLTKTNVKVNAASYKLPTEVREGTTDNYVVFILQDQMIAFKKVTKQDGYKLESGSWKYTSNKECYEGSGYLLKGANDVYTFGSQQINENPVTIVGQQGHKIVVDISAGQKPLTIQATGALTSLTLNVPASGDVQSVTFKDNINVATVNFKKVEAGKTVGSTLVLTASGVNVQLTFNYEVATETTIDFTKYRTVTMAPSTNYAIVFGNLIGLEYKNVSTNIILSTVTYKLPSKESHVNGDVTHAYKFSLGTNGVVMLNVVKYLSGYILQNNAYKYSKEILEGTEYVAKTNNVYVLNCNKFTPASKESDWADAYIFAEKGHVVEVHFNNVNQFNFHLNNGSIIETTENVSYKLVLYNKGKDYGIQFVDVDNDIENVDIKLMKKEQNVTQNKVYIKGDNAKSQIKYVIDYELKNNETMVPFDNYTLPIWQEDTSFTIDFANKIKEMPFNSTTTNIGIANTCADAAPSKITHTLANGTKLYIYFQTSSAIDGWYTKLIATQMKTELPLGTGYVLSGGEFVYKKNIPIMGTIVLEETKNVFKINSTHLGNYSQWTKFHIKGENGHTITIHFDIGLSANFFLGKGDTLGSNGKAKYNLFLYDNKVKYGIYFHKCDGKLEDVDVTFMKRTYERTDKDDSMIYMKNGCEYNGENCVNGTTFKTPIKYVINYQLDKDEKTIPFDKYHVAVWQLNTAFNITFALFGKDVLFEEKTTNIGLDSSLANVESLKPKDAEIMDNGNDIFLYFALTGIIDKWYQKVTFVRSDYTYDYSGVPIKGYVHTGDYVYKYSENINPNKFKGKYVEETNGVFKFEYKNYYPQYTTWEKVHLWAKDGHKFEFTLNIQGKEGADFEFFGETGRKEAVKTNVTAKTKYTFYLPCRPLHYGLHFAQLTDDIDMYFTECEKSDGKNIYVKNLAPGKLVLKYRVHYKAEKYGLADFEHFHNAIFQQSLEDIIEFVDLPATTVYGKRMNIGIDGVGPFIKHNFKDDIIRDFVHVRCSEDGVAWFGWIYLIMYKESDKPNMKSGYWRPDKKQYSYTYSDYILPQFETEGDILKPTNNMYTLTKEYQNNVAWQPTVIIPKGKTAIEINIDRQLSAEVDNDGKPKDIQPKIFVRTNKVLDSSQSYVSLKFIPSDLDGEIAIQQEEKLFDIPIMLHFAQPSEDEYTTPMYVKGNSPKYLERRDENKIPVHFETVKYDVMYSDFKFNDINNAFFGYKRIYLQQYCVGERKASDSSEMEEVIGLEMNNIYFGGKLPLFSEDGVETNIYADPEAGQPLPDVLVFNPQKYDSKHNVTYMLIRDDNAQASPYYITQFLTEVDNAGFNPDTDIPKYPQNHPNYEKPKPAEGGASSLFIYAILFVLVFFF